MSGKSSGAQPQGNGDAKHRQHNDGSSGRAFTVEQKAAVIRIKRCAPTAYYEILNLEAVKSTCSDGDIKKAYRKQSLLTHPDKNGYDGADDAFKMVSKAFQVLSDPDKKKKYDSYGGDPDARFNPNTAGGGGGGGSPFPGGFNRGGGGFQEEMTPEELFRQFFGGAFGGPFGTYNSTNTPTSMDLSRKRELIDYQEASTPAQASSSTLAAALVFASTNLAAVHHGDDQQPHNLPAANHNPPSPPRSPTFSRSSSSSSSHYSPPSSAQAPQPQDLRWSSKPHDHHKPKSVSRTD